MLTLTNLGEHLHKMTEGIISSLAITAPQSQVERAVRQLEALFQGYARVLPGQNQAYAAAHALISGHTLSDMQRYHVAGALGFSIKERGVRRPFGSPHLTELLAIYAKEARAGELMRMTWYGLLSSYFAFSKVGGKEDELDGWEKLRKFLVRSWPSIETASDPRFSPDWVRVMRTEAQLLSQKPAEKYGEDYLAGRTEVTDKIAADMGIPPLSWFWDALVLGAVSKATAGNDASFKRYIPRLIDIVRGNPAYQNEAVTTILTRYHRCADTSVNTELRDFVIDKKVWKNPKLKDLGYATAWNQVEKPVWQMVLHWVNAQNLRDFFDVLYEQDGANKSRLLFWEQYLPQITWTRLIFGLPTQALTRRNDRIRALIAREEGAYATLTVNTQTDAFMMQIGDYIVVEFSKTGNACYVYKKSSLKFELTRRDYEGSTSDLKYGFHLNNPIKIPHHAGWEVDAKAKLAKVGILPTVIPKSVVPVRAAAEKPSQAAPASISQLRTATAPSPGGMSRTTGRRPNIMPELKNIKTRHRTVEIEDKRQEGGTGCIWVTNSSANVVVESELKALGGRWSDKKQSWYF